MKVRPALIRPEWIRVWRRAVLGAAGASLAAVTVAGCTGGGPSSVFTPTPQISTSSHSGAGSRTPSPSGAATSTVKASASVTASATGKATATASATRTARPTASDKPTATPAATHRPTATPAATHRATHAATSPATRYPVGAPQTGGGGTAGLQDVTLFGIGGAAILSGIASLAYRRRLTRKRRTNDDTTPSTPTHATTR